MAHDTAALPKLSLAIGLMVLLAWINRSRLSRWLTSFWLFDVLLVLLLLACFLWAEQSSKLMATAVAGAALNAAKTEAHRIKVSHQSLLITHQSAAISRPPLSEC